MQGVLMEAEKAVMLMRRVYERSRVKFGDNDKELTVPALTALRDAERVRDYLKEHYSHTLI